MVDSVLEVKQIKQLSADGGATVVDVENKKIDGTTIGGTTRSPGFFTNFASTGIDDDAASLALRLDSSGSVCANTFKNLAGTDAPDFPNGLTLAGNTTGGNITGVTLDDYEEGTFTLTGKDSGSSTVFTATNQVYQKIGNRCFVEIFFTNSTATNTPTLEGLPFVASGQSWAPNSQFFDRYTTVNDGTDYISWSTSSTATRTVRMQFSYQTV